MADEDREWKEKRTFCCFSSKKQVEGCVIWPNEKKVISRFLVFFSSENVLKLRIAFNKKTVCDKKSSKTDLERFETFCAC